MGPTIHEMAHFPLQIASLDEDAAEFTIHLVGIQPQTDHCMQQGYQDMRQILDMSALPMFILAVQMLEPRSSLEFLAEKSWKPPQQLGRSLSDPDSEVPSREFRLQNWLVHQVALYQDEVHAVVVFSHGYPNPEDYPNLWEEFNDVAEFLPNMPFLWLQGEALQWVDDEPYGAKNVRRVVVDGGGHADPVLVTIDPEPTNGRPFLFERRPLSQL